MGQKYRFSRLGDSASLSQFDLGQPIPLSKFKLPKIKIPDIPQLPEEQRRQLRRIQEQLSAELRDDQPKTKDASETR